MSAFAQSSFKAVSYMTARPTYPEKLFNYIASYNQEHNPSGNFAGTKGLDIGCGPGEATAPLTKVVDYITGLDPSQVMIKAASEKYKNIPNVSFTLGSDQTFANQFPVRSLDLITVAQAIHWFEFPEFFLNAHKVLKPNGTLAFWGYVDHIYVGHPKATQITLDYCYGQKYLGPFWQQPGRDRLRAMLDVAQPPNNLFKDIRRVVNEKQFPDPSEVLDISQTIKLSAVLAYMKTYSAYHLWKKRNPDERDICEQCIDKIKKSENWTDDTEVTIKWSTILCSATAI